VSDYISDELRERIRLQAGDRCGYCLSPQHLVMGTLEIEHILPKSTGGSTDEANLWLACRLCNNFKASQTQGINPETGDVVALFNPRQQRWSEHFQWDVEATHIRGTTPCGRATAAALRLNNLVAVTVRQYWVDAGWHPPLDSD
jgi:hypothetical protein